MTTIYNIYISRGDGDSNIIFEHLDQYLSLSGALDYVRNHITDKMISEFMYTLDGVGIHPNVSINNDFTFIGTRKECDGYLMRNMFGGYVIEENTIKQ